jgi:hypothetical protein
LLKAVSPQKTYYKGTTKVTFDLSSVAAGTYVLAVENKSVRKTVTIVVI